MGKEKSDAGRPPVYKTPEEMQIKIDEYFERCAGETLVNADGDTVYDKHGRPIIINDKPPTITGLALALGFNSRTSLLNYAARDGKEGEAEKPFLNTITRAKSRVEEYAEMRLFDKDGANGAKFSLANNFKQWKEKPDGAEMNNNAIIKVTLTDD